MPARAALAWILPGGCLGQLPPLLGTYVSGGHGAPLHTPGYLGSEGPREPHATSRLSPQLGQGSPELACGVPLPVPLTETRAGCPLMRGWWPQRALRWHLPVPSPDLVLSRCP